MARGRQAPRSSRARNLDQVIEELDRLQGVTRLDSAGPPGRGPESPAPSPVDGADDLDEIIERLDRIEGVREFAATLERVERQREGLYGAMAQHRQERGLSQSRVAALMGTSQPAIARLEAGLTDAKLSTLDRYAAAIGYELRIRWQPAAPARVPAPPRLDDVRVATGPPLSLANPGRVSIARPRAEQILQELFQPGGTTIGRQPHEVLFRGWLRHQRGDLQAARDLYNQVIESGDEDAAPRAMRNLGLVLEKEQDFDRAVELYHEAAASGHPEVAPAAGMNEGWLLTQLGRHEPAMAAYNQVIDSGHPDHVADARINRALLMEKQGEVEAAVDRLQEVIDRGQDEQAIRATRHLGLLRRKHGQPAEAVELFEQVIQSGHPRLAEKAGADLRHLRRKLGRSEDAGYEAPPETPLEQAISKQDEASTVREELLVTEEVSVLVEPARHGPEGGRGEGSKVLSLRLEREGRQEVAVPIFTRPALVAPALVRLPDLGSRPVATFAGRQLLANLGPDQTLVINPWTPLESWIRPAGDHPGGAASPQPRNDEAGESQES